MIDLLGSTFLGSRSALIALDLALKATALMTFTFACHGALGRRRALARSALWNACLIGLLLLPAACLAFPRLHVIVAPTRSMRRYETAAPSRDVPPAAKSAADDVLSVSQSSMDRDTMGSIGSDAVRQPASGRPYLRSEDQPAPRLGGTGIAVTVYLAMATLLLLRLAASVTAVARLRRQCVVVEDEQWVGALDFWRTRLGITRRVPLLASERVSVPIVAGWLCPAIIIPKAMAAKANSPLIGAVLVHELAHVRRADYGWNLVRKLVQIVYWPNPLVWLVGWVVGSVREQACDDLCVYGLGGAAAYRNSLIEVASGLVRLPDPALGMAMARATNLGRRLAWIDRTRGAPRCLSRWPARLALGLAMPAVAGVLGAVELARATATANPGNTPARSAEMPQENPRPDQPSWIEVTVRAKDSGRPLEGATVRP
ncbi:MAG TPA: M56 family metallopeptidase, partial [Isosphaeraceae bacterium]|nr:M56 family metallopeptidase [Isosphaeraceae bacterium]